MGRIGFACKLLAVPQTAIKTCLLKNATPERLVSVATHNLLALKTMIIYCQRMGIPMMRISSDSIPLATHPAAAFDWRQRLAQPLAEVASVLATGSTRVSMHPGQYTVLNSPRNDVVERAIEELRYHADFLDALGVPACGKLVLHVGGVYGERTQAITRFASNFSRLPENVQKRLVLENDEKCFAVHDVLPLCQRLGIPCVFDTLHHAVNPAPEGTLLEWLHAAASSWKPQDGTQKIHYSQQRQGSKVGAHSATIAVDEFLAFYRAASAETIDIMLEVKDKNISALKCMHITTPHLPANALQQAWARYKYAVLERSHSHYLALRQQFAHNTVTPHTFYTACDEALALPLQSKGAVNAAQHVWGYVTDHATPAEKTRYQRLEAELTHNPAVAPRMKAFLYTLAERDKQMYLLASYYFCEADG